MFGLFRKKDPICGMREEKGTGVEKFGKWFCNINCAKEYEAQLKNQKQDGHKDCCH